MPRAVAASLGVRSGVQQREQAGEPFVRMGGVIGPSPEQRPLDGGIKDVAGKGRLAAQPQGDRRVDEDELAALRPAEEAAQHVCSLVAVAVGAVAEECFQVGGGHPGPAGHRPGGCQVDGQVAEDPEPGLQGDVADRCRPARRARSRSSSWLRWLTEQQARSPPWTTNGTMIAYRDYSMISLGEGGTLGVLAVLDGGLLSRRCRSCPAASGREASVLAASSGCWPGQVTRGPGPGGLDCLIAYRGWLIGFTTPGLGCCGHHAELAGLPASASARRCCP